MELPELKRMMPSKFAAVFSLIVAATPFIVEAQKPVGPELAPTEIGRLVKVYPMMTQTNLLAAGGIELFCGLRLCGGQRLDHDYNHHVTRRPHAMQAQSRFRKFQLAQQITFFGVT